MDKMNLLTILKEAEARKLADSSHVAHGTEHRDGLFCLSIASTISSCGRLTSYALVLLFVGPFRGQFRRIEFSHVSLLT